MDFLETAVGGRGRAAHSDQIFVPLVGDSDLRNGESIDRDLVDGCPDLAIYLTAVMGNIRANRKNPGWFFHSYAVIGIPLIEQAT